MKYITNRIINLAAISRAVDPGHPDHVEQTYADIIDGQLARHVAEAIKDTQQLEKDYNQACNDLASIHDLWLSLHSQIQQPNIAPGAKAVLQSIANDLADLFDAPDHREPLPKLNEDDSHE